MDRSLNSVPFTGDVFLLIFREYTLIHAHKLHTHTTHKSPNQTFTYFEYLSLQFSPAPVKVGEGVLPGVAQVALEEAVRVPQTRLELRRRVVVVQEAARLHRSADRCEKDDTMKEYVWHLSVRSRLTILRQSPNTGPPPATGPPLFGVPWSGGKRREQTTGATYSFFMQLPTFSKKKKFSATPALPEVKKNKN